MWPLAVSRSLALAFAIILAIAEALINSSQPEWQYAPLWIIDYVIVAGLLAGFWLTRRFGHVPVLMTAWALGAGVFYMALFVSLDPELGLREQVDSFFLFLVGLGLTVQVIGLGLATVGHYRSSRQHA